MGDYSAALKFVYDAQAILVMIEKAGAKTKGHVILCTNFVTFHVLWRVGKYREAKTYISLCIRTINLLLHSRSRSRLSHTNQLNLMGLIAMSLSAVQLQVDSDAEGAIQTVTECIQQLESFDLAVNPLLVGFKQRLFTAPNTDKRGAAPQASTAVAGKDEARSPKATVPEHIRGRKANDWLISKDYDLLFFITTLLPFISTNMPLIRSSELEQAQAKQRKKHENGTGGSGEGPVRSIDGYTKLMKTVISKRNDRLSATIHMKPTSASPTSFRALVLHNPPSPSPAAAVSVVHETSRDRGSDHLAATDPSYDVEIDDSGQRRNGSVPPITTKKVVLSPNIDSSGRKKKHRRIGSTLMVELGPNGGLPLLSHGRLSLPNPESPVKIDNLISKTQKASKTGDILDVTVLSHFNNS